MRTSGLPDADRALLVQWLSAKVVPPTVELSFEIFHALARIACQLLFWRPRETEWQSVHIVSQGHAARLEGLRGAYSSSIAPLHSHAMYGDFKQWPFYSALAAGTSVPEDPTWTFMATLYAWKHIGLAIPGCHVPDVAKTHREVVETWLRESVKNPDRLKLGARLIDGATSPRGLLAKNHELTKNGDRALWAAFTALADAYCRSANHESRTAPITQPHTGEPRVGGTISKIVDVSVLDFPDDEGLAPEDAGGVRYKSEDGDQVDPASDLLWRTSVRLIATARENNHTSLYWDSLNRSELRVLRTEIERAHAEPEDRTGAVGLTLCAALAIDPAQAARLVLHASIEHAQASLDRQGMNLAWCGMQLVALQVLPSQPGSYQRPIGVTNQLPHSPFNIVGIPDPIATAISDAGGVPGYDLIRIYPNLAHATRDLAAKIRKKHGVRLHLGRIRRSVADQIYRNTLDECVVAMVLPGARTPSGTGGYYSAIPAKAAYEVHRLGGYKVLPWTSPALPPEAQQALGESWIGSQLLLPIEDVRDAISHLHARAAAATTTGRRTTERLAAAFNAQTVYVAVVCMLLTGHRSTIAPFPHPRDFCLETKRVVIADKRSNLRTEQRVVPLAHIAVQQLTDYWATVAAVATTLDGTHPQLSGELRSLLQHGDEHPSQATFTLMVHVNGEWALRPIGPRDWESLWPEWRWPCNGNRHLLMQLLQSEPIRRETLNVQFGHAELGQTAFGIDSAVPIEHFSQEIIPALEKISDLLGIKRLPPIGAYNRGIQPSQPITLPVKIHGDARTERNRFRPLTTEDLALARRVLRHPSIAEEADPMLAEQAALGLAKDEFSDAPRIRGRVLQLISRWFRLRARGNRTTNKRTSHTFASQASPIIRTELIDLDFALRARGEILEMTCQFLKEQSAVTSGISDWIAHIYLSAVAFGGALDTRFLTGFLSAIKNDIDFHGTDIWFDWTHNKTLYRWVVEPITAQLFIAFHKAHGKPIATPTPREVTLIAGEFLASLPAFRKFTPTKCVERILSSMLAFCRDKVAGCLVAHMSGARRSSPVPTTTLLRGTGARLERTTEAKDAAKSKRNLETTPFKQTIEGTIENVLKLLSGAQGSGTRGGVARGNRGQRINVLKASLLDLENSCAVPATTMAVISRINDLIESGGRVKEVLATSTIYDYMKPVLTFVSTSVGKHFLTADAEAIEQQYRSIVHSGCASKAAQRLASLQDFHDHAVAKFGAPRVDWSEIAGNLPHARSNVDANLVYPHELALADALIERAEGLPSHLRLIVRVALYLMGKLGLRIGEVIRLRVKDVPLPLAFLYVRNTDHGEVKSPAGVRQVPIRRLLGKVGTKALHELVERARHLGNGDVSTPLCCEPGANRDLVLRTHVERLVSEALRVATGDHSIRPHHLRHSAITATYDLVVTNGGNGSRRNWAEKQLRLLLLGETSATRRAAHAHSQLFGQAGSDVTAITYVHGQEFRIARAMSECLPRLTSNQIALLTGHSDASVRKFWSKNVNTCTILQRATRKKLGHVGDWTPWRNIAATRAPLTHSIAVNLEVNQLSLFQLHVFLKRHHAHGMPTEALANLYSVPLHLAKQLLAGSRELSIEHGFCLSFVNPKSVAPWPGHVMRSPIGKKTPPLFRKLECIKQMDKLEATDALRTAAGVALRTFDPDQHRWQLETVKELGAVALWLHSLHIPCDMVFIEMPCAESEVPDSMRAWAGLMAKATFASAPPLDDRKRGNEKTFLRAYPNGDPGTATTLVHATYLWLLNSSIRNTSPPTATPKAAESA